MRLMAVCYGFGKLLGGCGGCCLLYCCLLSAFSCLLFVVCCLLSAFSCLLFVICCQLSVVCCLLLAVCCLLFVFCSLSSAVCCLLPAVYFCYLFTICSLFVHPLYTFISLSFRSLFVLCSLSVCCRQLFASCMPAAVGRKIKYRFPAWQAPEVFSKRQPLIFSHYLCLCGSFFSLRLCGIYVMCVPRQYSCLRPSGRCRMKRPFSTTFSNSL